MMDRHIVVNVSPQQPMNQNTNTIRIVQKPFHTKDLSASKETRSQKDVHKHQRSPKDQHSSEAIQRAVLSISSHTVVVTLCLINPTSVIHVHAYTACLDILHSRYIHTYVHTIICTVCIRQVRQIYRVDLL